MVLQIIRSLRLVLRLNKKLTDMANLPNKPFVFNFNARDYNPATFTIPKTSGQTMDMDMVWTGSTRENITFVDDHISIPESAYTFWNFGSQAANPMNLTGSTKNLTLVFKIRQTGGNTKGTFFANRGEASNNYVLRIGTETGYNTTNIHLDGSTTTFAEPSGLTYNSVNVLTAAVRVTNMQVEIMNLETGDNNTPYTITCPQASVQFAFFGYKGNYSYANEPMSGDFYWCYASREVLTDAEIEQVVKYNEGIGLSLSSTGETFNTTGGTTTITVDSETDWTATGAYPWVSFSPASGESGTTTVTITTNNNLFATRTGVISFTDGEDTETFTATQEEYNSVPTNNLYLNGGRIN